MVQRLTWVRSLETNKSGLRKEKLTLRKNLSENERIEKSLSITDRLLGIPEFDKCKNVLIYASYNNEVETDRVVLKAMLKGKNIYMPKVNGDEMEFYRVFSLDELAAGAFGIREPYDIEHLKYDGVPETVCILPMAVFDNEGNRIGYGKGYYDKYLSRINVDYMIGLAFECQRSEVVIDTDKHDRKLHIAVTEANTYRF